MAYQIHDVANGDVIQAQTTIEQDTQIAANESAIGQLQTKVNQIETNMPDTTQIESDVSALQASVGGLTTTVNEMNTTLGTKMNEPTNEGTNGQVLTTDGNGNRTWTTVQGGGGSSVEIDDTLSQQGEAADAKAAGDALATKLTKPATDGTNGQVLMTDGQGGVTWETASETKWLNGKRVSILGDSISTYRGYLTPSSNTAYYPSCQNSPYADLTSVDQTWWKIAIDKAGMVLGANNSFSGRTLISSATTENVMALGENGTPDIILVYLGTNDANQRVTLGTLDTTVPFNVNSSENYGETLGTNLTQEQVDALGTTNFYEAVRTLIIRLQWYYPKARIVFINFGFGSYARFYANNVYRQAINECCDLMGVEVIDVRKAGIHMPRLVDYTLQRVHPNKLGMQIIGEYVYNKLSALYGNYMYQPAQLTGFSHSGTPTRTSYNVGDSFESAGLTFAATYADNTSRTIPPSLVTFTPNPLTFDTTSVTASYTDGDITETSIISGITVVDTSAALTDITYTGTLTTTEYIEGENFDPTGLVFTAHFADASTQTINNTDIVFSPDPLTANTTSVIASYTHNGVTKTVGISDIIVRATITTGDYRHIVFNSPSELTFRRGSGQTSTTFLKFSTPGSSQRRSAPWSGSTAYAPAINGQVIAVNGGDTVNFTIPDAFTALEYALYELDANATYVTDGHHFNSWLSAATTVLSENTRYLGIYFKPNGGDSDSTEAQLLALKSAITITHEDN